ncbi:KAT8_1 [Blepharisma stoltei]|uniref:histone acetyltransferase n=1 Tax=Blepharisma stoltei TaxID=1481888 RepID=A0AAU9ISW1_9CILI|nr:unnamed protein product [Blepharisma stoltei]
MESDLKIGSRVLCKWTDGKYYPAEIVHERSIPSHEFYIHYLPFNKRLDTWIAQDQIAPLPPDSDKTADSMVTRYNKRKREEQSPTNQSENFNSPELTQFEKDHEENTKVRNVDRIILGRYEISPWYYSPYLSRYPHIPTLYICEFCLKYMRHGSTYREHVKKCLHKKPMGKMIYRDNVNFGKVKSVSVYEVMGNEHKLYCQNFCLLAKLFLDHKTLYYYVSPFKFYVLTEDSGKCSRVVGYFSKEIGNHDYNLACILILPPYQQRGYGRFLISLSYELSKREGKIGTPERPLSDMGRISYKSYWTDTILEVIRDRGNLTIKEITDITGIANHDVMETLTSLNLVKYWKGQHIMNIANPKMIEEHFKKKEQRKKKLKIAQIKFDPRRLNYTVTPQS